MIIIIIIFRMRDQKGQQKGCPVSFTAAHAPNLTGQIFDLWSYVGDCFFPWASHCHPSPQAEASPATQVVEEHRPPASPATGRPLSPRQRRAQQHSQQGQRNSRDPASRPAFTPAPRQPQVESNAGSAVLIVLLTLALAALIFRRIYLAQEYELWPSRLPSPFLTLELSPPATTQTELTCWSGTRAEASGADFLPSLLVRRGFSLHWGGTFLQRRHSTHHNTSRVSFNQCEI